ncbi:bL21 family ribosomal protein, partial [Aeromicrobium sp.]
MVYAVVRAGGRQEKIEVGSIVVLDRIKADKDGNVELVPVLLVDGDTITHDASALAKVKVTAEVVGDLRGP